MEESIANKFKEYCKKLQNELQEKNIIKSFI